MDTTYHPGFLNLISETSEAVLHPTQKVILNQRLVVYPREPDREVWLHRGWFKRFAKWYVDLDKAGSYDDDEEERIPAGVLSVPQANMLSSEVGALRNLPVSRLHLPAFDVDALILPRLRTLMRLLVEDELDNDPNRQYALIPSTTQAHYHCYKVAGNELRWDEYHNMLQIMQFNGIVESGYLGAAERRQATYLRLPWVIKETSGNLSEPRFSCMYCALALPTLELLEEHEDDCLG